MQLMAIQPPAGAQLMGPPDLGYRSTLAKNRIFKIFELFGRKLIVLISTRSKALLIKNNGNYS
jgi:hypothetical protein